MGVANAKQGVILVVDDTPTNLEVLFHFLSDSGFRILIAEDGKSAIQKAEYATPDLILLDIIMPGIDGFETCRRLKAAESTRDIPVIFMTAMSETVDKIRGLPVGAVDYITKPLQHEEVLARVQTHLRLRNLTKQLQAQNLQLEQEINERKQLEESLRNTNAELQHFASIASHDLQEPLRKIQAFGNLLQEKCSEALGEQGRDYVDRMQKAAQRMQTLIDDLLTFSRITTRSKPFVSVNLADVTQEVLSDLEVLLQKTAGCVDVGELPTIDADPLQMRQLLQNLIGNALKFHREDEPPCVRLYSQIIERQEGQSTEHPVSANICQITVADNGIGFDQKYIDRIFQVFQRLHGRSEYEGTGMGLAICRKIVERHGGWITAESMPGQGAKFIITLPMERHERSQELGGASCTGRVSGGAQTGVQKSGVRKNP